MEIIEIDADHYEELSMGTHIYSSKKFLELNAYKVDKVLYLLGKDTKNRFVFASGLKDLVMLAPFSAPFSSIIPLRKDNTIEQYWDFVHALIQYAQLIKLRGISLYLPSDIYEYQNNVKLTNALLGNGFSLSYVDVNYSFNLEKIEMRQYESLLHYNARKSLKIALKSDLQILPCHTINMKKEAYDIIRINRESRGFPLRMSLDQVMSTIEIIGHNFFLVKHGDLTIASAIVFHVTSDIAQVVYWGNIPDVPELKPINYLSYKLVEYYKEKNYRHLDIGISTEDGIPNFGLCSFKDSIGCEVSYKMKYDIDLNSVKSLEI